MIIEIPSHTRNHGRFEKYRTPRWIVIHDAEAESAISVAKQFTSPNLKKPVSAHYVVDDNYIVKCLSDEVIAWTAGPNANSESLQIELCGFAAYSDSDWWEKHEATLYNAALVIDMWVSKHKIPIAWIEYGKLKSLNSKGLTTHRHISNELGGTDHQDPGPNFPSKKFLQKCNDVHLLPSEYKIG